jgi:outer membrane protein assembly factor BamB
MIDIDGNGKIEFSKIVVRLLDWELHMEVGDPFYKKNLMAIDKYTQNILWIVDYPKDSFFVAIRKRDDGSLIAYTYDGDIYNIDINTGKAKKIGWSK